MGTVTRYIGRCGVCEGDYKLLHGELVHHGYRRPGVGYIVGDCFGVGYAPYERSTAACEMYSESCAIQRHNLGDYLERLRAGRVNELTIYEVVREGFGQRREVPVVVRRDADDPKEREKFERAHRIEISSVGRKIEFLGEETGRMARLIENFVERPLRTVEEFERQVDEALSEKRSVRDAERSEKRRVREERRAQLDAKRDRWEAEKQELMAKYRGLLARLALEDPPNKLQASNDWRAMHTAMNRKGYLHFYPSELDIDDVLIRLGLAERVSWGRGVNYAGSTGLRFT